MVAADVFIGGIVCGAVVLFVVASVKRIWAK